MQLVRSCREVKDVSKERDPIQMPYNETHFFFPLPFSLQISSHCPLFIIQHAFRCVVFTSYTSERIIVSFESSPNQWGIGKRCEVKKSTKIHFLSNAGHMIPQQSAWQVETDPAKKAFL